MRKADSSGQQPGGHLDPVHTKHIEDPREILVIEQ
jgi:hypothetical protein